MCNHGHDFHVANQRIDQPRDVLFFRTNLPAELGRHGLGEHQQPKCLSGVREQRGILLRPQYARLQVLETAQVAVGSAPSGNRRTISTARWWTSTSQL